MLSPTRAAQAGRTTPQRNALLIYTVTWSPTTPPAPTNVEIYLDKNLISQDASNG